MTALSVNLNKIALLRNSREGNFPNVVEFGRLCLESGADGLTVHPRPDGRHIRPDDVYELSELVRAYPNREFNIEGNPFAPTNSHYPGLVRLVEDIRPNQCTLVPDSDSQLTSDHGFDLTESGPAVAVIVSQLKELGVRSSLFMDPDLAQIQLCHDIGADRIELYTGPYAEAFQHQFPELHSILNQHVAAAEYANQLGLGVNAGHDLNLENLPAYRVVPKLLEVSIGHALTVDALKMGMTKAIRRYLSVCA